MKGKVQESVLDIKPYSSPTVEHIAVRHGIWTYTKRFIKELSTI